MMILGIAVVATVIAIVLIGYLRLQNTDLPDTDMTLDDHLDEMEEGPEGSPPAEPPVDEVPDEYFDGPADFPENFPHRGILERQGVTYRDAIKKNRAGLLQEIPKIGEVRSENISVYIDGEDGPTTHSQPAD